jgi:hypothetical protein
MLDQVLNRAHLDTSLFLKRKTVISPHHAAAFKGGLPCATSPSVISSQMTLLDIKQAARNCLLVSLVA